MARMTGSWLSGPSAALPKGQTEAQAYRGELLGLPADGPGSLAALGRRVLALAVDWFTAAGVVMLLIGEAPLENPRIGTYTLMLWFLVGVACVSLFSFTPGQYMLGLQVARVDAPAKVGFLRALGRQALMVFIVPAVITDVDGRGMHDRATGTALVRMR
ncbi:RDD family protein [Rhodococcus spongiicola]|uniref:RDD family protein n=1 Tax=Rhodococcus spongiicola TaxID=2487352 RepID=A0A3S3B7N4_9NOCA|nr:RDD family protein [Rhodococcus spongiicola]RVW05059.1 RDD family protein [Rhodococcus spongiicola]